MKLRSSKAALYAGIVLVMLLMPILPVVVDAQTTYEQQQSTNLKDTKQASYVENALDLVATGQESNKETGMLSDKAIAVVDPYIDVYASDDESSDIEGRIYKNGIAGVIEKGQQWTKIKSGNVSGYVKSSALCFGDEAEYIAKEYGSVTATIISDVANIYSSPNNGEVIMSADNEQTFEAVAKDNRYIAILLEDGTRGYVTIDNVAVNYGFDLGYNNEEAAARDAAEEAARIAAEQARIAAEEARKAEEAARKAEEERKRKYIESIDITYSPTMQVSDDEIWLLACIVDWESGWEEYDGKLAVANAVLNRVRSGRYANTITGVVYARSQFSGVSDGYGNPTSTFASRLAAGPRTSECMQAALEALSGVNNIGTFTSFNSVSVADYSAYERYTIIGAHVFH